MNRRHFLADTALVAAAIAIAKSAAAERPSGAVRPLGDWGEPLEIAGDARQRGRAYGEALARPIREFYEREVAATFSDKPNSRRGLVAYAAACGKKLAEACPAVSAEIDGIAGACGLSREELVLTQLHEELHHKGIVPGVEHCTAAAAGPPSTSDGRTYVGQTWDWMASVAGTSRIVRWRQEKGRTYLGYGFPGLWAGAGINSDGVALCWTSGGFQRGPEAVKDPTPPRVGIPSYALIAHLLQQPTLDDVEREARRDLHAGWFTFVMADAQGNLLNLEGSPRGIVVERGRGHMARVDFGLRESLGVAAADPVPRTDRCRRMLDHLDAAAGTIDGEWLRNTFTERQRQIYIRDTIDVMVFDCSRRAAHVTRGPIYGVDWKTFGMA